MQTISVIGVMSGSSMDGIDLACCNLTFNNNSWSYQITASETIPYNETWRQRLSQLYKQKADIFPKLDAFYGRYIGGLINDFIAKNNLSVDLIASHGHTAFHRPEAGFTAQIGNGAAINAITGIPVVCDFRTVDIALGGQGAPLVPVGDKLLFSNYDACLNLGGFANISIIGSANITAFDICPCNIVLNRAARWLKQQFDDEGKIAASAEVDPDLLDELNELNFYSKTGPKSLGRDWINNEFWPIVKIYPDTSEQEKLATLAEHISIQVADVLNKNNSNNVLVTGGGVHNTHLLNLIKTKTNAQLHIPENQIIDYKEALIFALLGVLRLLNQNNVLASVTGSKKDSIGGALYGNFLPLLDKIK
ncbi:MAG: anhydro-N-acetylmuramic acid kinase [Bacteroidia bacterium]